MGRIVSLNTSLGGVPKLPVPRARLGPFGLEGDVQRHTKFHGGPDRAVCLYSVELIEALNAEGHTIVPGALGETVTVEGIVLWELKEGDRLRLGGAVIEITTRADPCRAIRRCFKDENFNRISAKLQPQWARLYARVVVPSEIAVGDEVTTAPSSRPRS